MFKPKYEITKKIEELLEQLDKKNNFENYEATLPLVKNQESYKVARKIIENWPGPLTENLIQILNAAVLGNSEGSKSEYGTDGRGVRSAEIGQFVYQGPFADWVPSLMKDCLDWVTHSKERSFIKAAIFHFQFLKIHPFQDGNGRTARLLTSLIMKLHGYKLLHCYALEKYFEENKKEYYKALDSDFSYIPSPDMTLWIEYFCESCCEVFLKV